MPDGNDRGKDDHISSTDNFTDKHYSDYAEYYCKIDIWAIGGAKIGANRAFISDEVVSERELVRSEIYNGYTRYVPARHMLGSAAISVEPDRTGRIGIHRPRGR